ncbi:MAG: hypothetical protein ACI819_001693, partial [Neolewinella sp.]
MTILKKTYPNIARKLAILAVQSACFFFSIATTASGA